MSAAVLDRLEADGRLEIAQELTWKLLPVELPGDCWSVVSTQGLADKLYEHRQQRDGVFFADACTCFHPIIVQNNGSFYTKYELIARKIGRCSITFINNLGEKRTFDFIC